MLVEETVNKMIKMKMFKMAESLKNRLSRADHGSLSQAEFIGLLVDDEYQERENKKMSARLKNAKFKQSQACIESIDYQDRNIKKKNILDLAQNEWIKKHQNICITGASGSGKSYLAQALGNNACRSGFTVGYARFAKLLMQLSVARADGTYMSKLKKISKLNVLILDDFGLTPIDDLQKQDLFEIIEDRYSTGSTIIAAQLPTEHWHEYLGGGMLGDGICDRILHNSHKIQLESTDSFRKKYQS
jgi:DNA replication protein DnaC